ncbi:hypothetical protein EW146_g7486 [Bondarzewia mesenterica]|uniref:Uncharacterized protein n=1 Tax=Bondarzewia mesenterica TaxID=1095465 RepID=A0A4S4LMG6_9AGAM|nr:hypothetical protein EW146_g7486 [Bondarzewia mesenterica]
MDVMTPEFSEDDAAIIIEDVFAVHRSSAAACPQYRKGHDERRLSMHHGLPDPCSFFEFFCVDSSRARHTAIPISRATTMALPGLSLGI